MTTRRALLDEGISRLRAAEVPGAERDARVLLRWAAGISAAALSASLDEEAGEAEADRFAEALADRIARRPVSQIVGEREFWGRPFRVTEAVLDPRPETEALIEAALAGPAPARILDLGVGSGCILLTLLAEWPGATGLGVDASPAALAVAAENAARLGVADRADFAEGDWLEGVAGPFDLIVSNPPYVPALEMEGLQPEIRGWEPRMALTPGGDGLDAYRAIAPKLKGALAPGGRAILEFGAGQADAVKRIFDAESLRFIRFVEDMGGRRRCMELAI